MDFLRAEQSARASLVQAQTHARLIIVLAKGKHIAFLRKQKNFGVILERSEGSGRCQYLGGE